MRIIGWALIVVGVSLFARILWIGAKYFDNMSPESQMRFYVAIPVSLLIVAAGVLVLRRQKRHAARK